MKTIAKYLKSFTPTPTKTIKLIIVGLPLFTEKSMLVLSFKQKCLPLLVSIQFTRVIKTLLLLTPSIQCQVGRRRENKKSSETKGCCLGVLSQVHYLEEV